MLAPDGDASDAPVPLEKKSGQRVCLLGRLETVRLRFKNEPYTNAQASELVDERMSTEKIDSSVRLEFNCDKTVGVLRKLSILLATNSIAFKPDLDWLRVERPMARSVTP